MAHAYHLAAIVKCPQVHLLVAHAARAVRAWHVELDLNLGGHLVAA
jgi:hypothetical protein